MKHLIFSIALAAAAVLPAHAALSSTQFTFSGNTLPVITETPAASTGLQAVYVLNAIEGVTLTYSGSQSGVVWSRFDSGGGRSLEEITDITHNGSEWTLNTIEGDTGYKIEDNGNTYFMWIVNYGAHRYSVNSITVGPDSDCDNVVLIPSGSGDVIRYYSINGAPLELDRGIELRYNTLSFNSDTKMYNQIEASETFSSLKGLLYARAPLCDTRFTLSGDRFLKAWGQQPSPVETEYYNAIAVEAQAWATQEQRDNDNEQSTGDDSSLGGSGPVDITFTAAVSDAVVFKEWQMSHSSDFDPIDMRVNDLEFTQTFQETGTTYVRFIASNAAGTCDYTCDIESPIVIGQSALLCPNAFSPGATEGVNDIWKVSYRSIRDFECHIFNRHGVKLCSFTNPADGWDGKYGGKVVPAGVYYYVIKAKGTDGKNYNLSGDINVVNYK